MAVPTYQSALVRRSGGMPTVLTDPSLLVEGLAAVGPMVSIRAERLRRSDEEDRSTTMAADFSRRRADAYRLHGKNAMDVVQDADDEYEDLYKSTVGSIEDPVTQENMDIRFRKSFEDHRNKLLSHQMQQEDEYLKDSDINNRAGDLKAITAGKPYDMKAIDLSIENRASATAIIQGPERWSAEHDVAYRESLADEYYTTAADQWYREDPDRTYRWFERNKKALKEKLSPAAFAILSKKQEAEYANAETLRIYRAAKREHGDDLLSAAAELKSPSNFKKYGIKDRDYTLAHAASNRFYNEFYMNKALETQNKQQVSDDLVNKYNESRISIYNTPPSPSRNRAFSALADVVRGDPNLSSKSRKAILQGIHEANYFKDPAAVARLNDMIDNRDITRKSQIQELLGFGIGDNLDPFYKRMAKVEKDLNASNTDYFELAVETFLKMHKGTTFEGDFRLRLEAKRRAEGSEGVPISKYDPKMLDFGNQLMGEQWYKKQEGGQPDLTWEYKEDVWGKGSPWSVGEKRRYNFQADPTAAEEEALKEIRGEAYAVPEIQPGQAIPKGATIPLQVPNTPQQTPAQTGGGRESQVEEFLRLRANPDAVPGDTVEIKVENLVNMAEAIEGRPLNDAEIDLLRRNMEDATY